MTIERPGAAAPRSRWPFYALIASLAVNLLFVGWVGAAMWHHRHGPGGWRGGEEGGLMGFARQVPEDRRAALRTKLKAARETVRPLRAAVNDAWTAANASLAAEPFDKAAGKAAFDRAIEADSKMRAKIDDELLTIAESLTSDERKALQAWREKRKPKMLRHHGRKDRDDKDDDGPGVPLPPPPAP